MTGLLLGSTCIAMFATPAVDETSPLVCWVLMVLTLSSGTAHSAAVCYWTNSASALTASLFESAHHKHNMASTQQATQPGEAKLVDLRGLKASGKEGQAEAEKRAQQELAPASAPDTQDGHPRALLNSGHSIPLIGLGTWKSEKGQVKAAVIAAIKAGYRHIDCAAVYGNEEEVGEGLQTVLKEGIVKREQLWVTSKLWNTEHAPERVEPACRKTLADLKLEYLDLYHMHWPSSFKPGPSVVPPLADTYAAMEDLVDKGLVRSIGVSNFSIVKLKDLMSKCRIPPAVVQVEAHPYWNNNNLVAWCGAHGIHVTAYSPLGSPDSASMMKRSEDVPTPLKDAFVKRVAESLGKSPAQVLIRWAVQRGTSVLPKSVNPERIASNLDVTSWSIPDDLYEQLDHIPTQIRMVPGTFLVNPAGPYKTLEELWDEPTPTPDEQKKLPTA